MTETATAADSKPAAKARSSKASKAKKGKGKGPQITPEVRAMAIARQREVAAGRRLELDIQARLRGWRRQFPELARPAIDQADAYGAAGGILAVAYLHAVAYLFDVVLGHFGEVSASQRIEAAKELRRAGADAQQDAGGLGDLMQQFGADGVRELASMLRERRSRMIEGERLPSQSSGARIME